MYSSAPQSNFQAFQFQTTGFQGPCQLPANPTLPSMPCAPSYGNITAQTSFFAQLMQTQQSLFSGWSNFCGSQSQQMPQGTSFGNNCYPQLPQMPQVPSWPQYGSYPQQSNCHPQLPALPPVPGWPSYGSYPQGQCQYPQLPSLPQMPQGPTCFGSPYPQMPAHHCHPPQAPTPHCPPPQVHIHDHYYNEQPAPQPTPQPAPQPVIWRTPATPLTRSLPTPPPAVAAQSTPFAPPAQPKRNGTLAAHSYGAFGPGASSQAVFNAAYFNNAQGGQAMLMGTR